MHTYKCTIHIYKREGEKESGRAREREERERDREAVTLEDLGICRSCISNVYKGSITKASILCTTMHTYTAVGYTCMPTSLNAVVFINPQ